MQAALGLAHTSHTHGAACGQSDHTHMYAHTACGDYAYITLSDLSYVHGQ